MRIPILLAAALLLAAAPPPAEPAPGNGPSYADLVDLALASPVVVRATVRKAEKQSPAELNAPPRALVTADVSAAFVAPGPVAPRVRYLWSGEARPTLGRQRVPERALTFVRKTIGQRTDLRGRVVLLFARPVDGHPDELRLSGPDAQVDWSSDAERRVRDILTALAQPGARELVITGIGGAFHTVGAVPGEAETQVFLQTADKRPVSLAVLSHPGQDKRVVLATGEVIDNSAKPVEHDTLTWYRLACFLPRMLPATSTAELKPDDADAARADYAAALASFGPCVRARGPA